MYKHILVPVDGSPTALQAVSQAVVIASAFGSAVTAIYVIDPYPFTGVGTEFAYSQAHYLSAAKAEAQEAFVAVRAQFEAAGLKVDTRMVEAHATWRGIIETADAIKADLVVMGSHGRHGLEKLVLGSVTQRVLQHATQPVLVVRG
jgi:nucleotide-binding universal stress UspA family protein